MSRKDRDSVAEITSSNTNLVENAVGVSGILANLFRQMLGGFTIKETVWANYMMDFISDPSNGYAKNIKDRMTARGNLNKEFADRKMTWKSFMKAVKFLKILEFKISIEVPDEHGGNSKVFSVNVKLKN